ncbi:MAG TPA: DinB family protein [Flavisolibacter sp.]|nr:DinB family protein [Flavisolibacter sp.]
MTFTQNFLKELEREAITTRKMLDRVPDDQFNWKPHQKSMSVLELATHIAEIPGWIPMVLNTSEMDFANNDYKRPTINNHQDLMNYFTQSLEAGKTSLLNAKDEQLNDTWTMRSGDKIFSSEPKLDVLRGVFSQVIHHRAQLGVYLRMLNIPIPGSYGPSADDAEFA